MTQKTLNVLIIGAGTGGLCLAQGLRRQGISVQVFERDRSAVDRQQGYRLSISASGSHALKACLPETLFKKLTQNSGQPSEAVTFLDHKLKRLLTIELPHKDRGAAGSERPISRTALRQILAEGLDDVIHFGKKFMDFECAARGGVIARFEDGSEAVGDVLAGADGANSRVRSLLLPDVKRVETGIWAVGGKLPLNDEVRALTPPAILRGPTPIFGPRGCFLFCSTVQYGDLKSEVVPAIDDREEYVMWGFTARRERFPFTSYDALGGEDLKSAVLGMMEDWHPVLKELVQRSGPSALHAFSIKTSVPVTPWRTRDVTLLGDAIHNMPPFRGVGANTALWDAAVLCGELAAVDRAEKCLLDALGDYEKAMIKHGFHAVCTSLRDMARFHAEGIDRALTKAFFRTVDLVPGLKATFLAGR